MKSYQLNVTLRAKNGKTLRMPTHAVDHMTDAMALSPILPEDVSHLWAGQVPIASMLDPDILVGVNMWPQLKITEAGVLPCGLLLQQSVLGPMICGDGLVRKQSTITGAKTVSVLTSPSDFIGSHNSSSSGGEGAAAPKTCGREEPPTSKRNTTRRSELLPSSYRPRVAELTRNEEKRLSHFEDI
ncbi:hypothetical protein Ddc_17879 [Ditylenchus destructor]|nr:hypothetical protein Ddc_17879 [Ditylenchus destructor]